MVNDFIQRLHPAGGDVRFHLLHELIQAAGRGIGFNLLVPLLLGRIMETMDQTPLFLGRKLPDGRLDFMNRAHADKMRRAFESASAEMVDRP